MRKKYFVIAGNHHQYLEFAKQKVTEGWPGDTTLSLSDFVYVSHSNTLRGYSKPHGFFVGTWRERKDIREILSLLAIAYANEETPKNLLNIMIEVLG